MRKFVCTESGNVYTEDELVALFCEFLKDDKSMWGTSFADWMRNASGKNGTLRELTPLTVRHREEISSACDKLREAMTAMRVALINVTEESYNRCLSDGYPFRDSWDEAFWETEDWICLIKNSLDDLEAEYR